MEAAQEEQTGQEYIQKLEELKNEGKTFREISFREVDGPESQLKDGEKIVAELVINEDDMQDAGDNERSVAERKAIVVSE